MLEILTFLLIVLVGLFIYLLIMMNREDRRFNDVMKYRKHLMETDIEMYMHLPDYKIMIEEWWHPVNYWEKRIKILNILEGKNGTKKSV